MEEGGWSEIFNLMLKNKVLIHVDVTALAALQVFALAGAKKLSVINSCTLTTVPSFSFFFRKIPTSDLRYSTNWTRLLNYVTLNLHPREDNLQTESITSLVSR